MEVTRREKNASHFLDSDKPNESTNIIKNRRAQDGLLCQDCPVTTGQVPPSYLHVSSFSCFYSCINETLTASHCVEEKLSRCQARVEAVGNKAFSCWKLEERERENVWNIFHRSLHSPQQSWKSVLTTISQICLEISSEALCSLSDLGSVPFCPSYRPHRR